ncbi:hypothetical protein Celaphus_00007951 [Cervus elaphus hippelaphus]|uniref:Uncharacterized protein n=1 Tax=Cervus elaphus hippelaphus TaxID=46360 RepID=A0A212CAD4_CEREH|nr:hypothetical protein Celaphus_00007951 [Cervus elaphus hippelaphus]
MVGCTSHHASPSPLSWLWWTITLNWQMTSAASSRNPVPCGGLAHSLARPYPHL